MNVSHVFRTFNNLSDDSRESETYRGIFEGFLRKF